MHARIIRVSLSEPHVSKLVERNHVIKLISFIGAFSKIFCNLKISCDLVKFDIIHVPFFTKENTESV